MSYEIFIGSLILLYLIMIYRFFKQLNNEDYTTTKQVSIRASYPDMLIKAITFMYAWYLLFHLKEYNPYIRITYLGFILIFLYVNYYPWFIILPLCLCLTYMIVGFGLYNLILFSLSIALCIYGLSQEPYKSRKEYQWLKIYYITVAFVCTYTAQMGYN
jgi:hypothetical protein